MSEITYTFAAGSGKYANMSVNLLESIDKNTDASQEDIIIYIVKEEKEQISNEYIEKMHKSATVVEGPMPNPNYPISAGQGALERASDISDNDYVLLLDSDTVVLDDITVQNKKNAELFLCPEFIGTRYWSDINRSYESWKDLYENYQIEFPPNLIRSVIDQKIMCPYYNGGVILTKNNDFPRRLVELSNEIHGNLPESNYFAEMVALALLTTDYSISVLNERHNFFQPLFTSPPPDETKIVHYNDITSYYKMLQNDNIRERLEGTKITEQVLQRSWFTHQYKSYMSSYLSYARKTEPSAPPYTSLRKWMIKCLETIGIKKYIKYALRK